MPATEVPAKTASLTADGTAAGVITIADTTDWLPGAKFWIVDDDAASNRECQVLDVVSTTTFHARIIDTWDSPDPGIFDGNNHIRPNPKVSARDAGASDFSAYTAAKHAVVSMPRQIVVVRQNFLSVSHA